MSNFLCDITGNEIFFTGDIQDDSAHVFVRKLRELEKEYIDKYDKNIILYLNSFGGSCTSGLRMYEALRKTTLNIVALAEGYVASSGTIVLLGCATRKATRYTQFLVHPISGGNYNTLPNNRSYLKFMENINDIYLEIYKEHTSITSTMMEVETYLTATQAKELNLIQEII